MNNPQAIFDTFEYHYGPINSPDAYFQYSTFAGRQTGKTFALVQAIPANTNVAVVVHKSAWGRELSKQIKVQRPDLDPRRIFFIPCRNGFDVADVLEEKTRGLNIGAVLIDNAVLDTITLNIQRQINKRMQIRHRPDNGK